MTTEAIILAGGLGKRMGLSTPKPLLDLCGKPLLQHILETAASVADGVHVVHGPGMEEELAALAQSSGIPFQTCLQKQPRGTADALACALDTLQEDATALVLCADTPLLKAEMLSALLGVRATNGLVILVTDRANCAFGRIIRNIRGWVVAVREYADADAAQRKITECSTGVMAATVRDWKRWIARISSNNAQNEYYLTDCVKYAAYDQVPIATKTCAMEEALGINTARDYAEVAAHWQQRARERLLDQGVFLEAPQTVQVSAGTEVASNAAVWIGPNVVFEGAVQIEGGVRIGANVVLRNCTIGADVQVEPFCVIEQAQIGARCRIGPYARIRPETELAEEVQIGNFVEVKKSRIGANTKVNHLSYVGDAQLGSGVNVGAGTITCNYDGTDKHVTVIEDDVFIGSGTQLVAPVTIEAGATIGAGSTITKDAPGGQLTLSRSGQTTVDGWKRKDKS